VADPGLVLTSSSPARPGPDVFGVRSAGLD
jgi:hypothetical protein